MDHRLPHPADDRLLDADLPAGLRLRATSGWVWEIDGDCELAEAGRPRLRSFAGEEELILARLQELAGEPLTGSEDVTGGLTLLIGADPGSVRVEVNTAATYPAWRLIDPDGVTCSEASTG